MLPHDYNEYNLVSYKAQNQVFDVVKSDMNPLLLKIIKGVSNCCLTPSKQFSRSIIARPSIARTSYILILTISALY